MYNITYDILNNVYIYIIIIFYIIINLNIIDEQIARCRSCTLRLAIHRSIRTVKEIIRNACINRNSP